jgi:class 3 adenylate cyclase
MTESVETATNASLEAGRDAVARHDWARALEAFTAADREAPLSPEDLELLGTAAWWSAHPDESNEALERAFEAYEAAGRAPEAAWAALNLAYQSFRGLNGPVGGGWIARAERLLADLPEGPIHARLAVFRALGALQSGQLEAGTELAEQAMDMARRQGETSALYMAMTFKGMAQLLIGKWAEGQRNIDEATAAASSGKLDLRVASDIYCTTIGACRSVGDLERAGDWCDEAERWMRRNGAGGYPGICRIHRAEIKKLRGHWSEAEQDARKACEELQRFRLIDGVGYGQNEIGDIRLRMGDLDAAAEAFDLAYEAGHDAQPGLARLLLARGEIAEAGRSIERALAETAPDGAAKDRATRARLLPAQVDIALAAGELDKARAAVEELESIAADLGRPLFQAGAMTARGELLLGEAKAAEASSILGKSWRLWQTTDLPYEAAQARVRYAEALAAEGDAAMAKRDLLGARAVFERLGAALELQRVDALLGDAGATAAGAGREGERVRRTFMFTDIVTSTDLVGLIGDEAWGELLTWHDRELRASIVDHHGVEVDHTGDGFFVAFERAADAIECAVDIQRRLVRHRREQGFAVLVRIGLHAAEATRHGRNYRGGGVHVAARVGAAAAKEEILVSSDTVRDAGSIRYRLSEPRSLQLKGVREPVEVRAVEWR